MKIATQQGREQHAGTSHGDKCDVPVSNKNGKSKPVVVVVKCVFFLTALLLLRGKEQKRKKTNETGRRGDKGKQTRTTADTARRFDLYNSSA